MSKLNKRKGPGELSDSDSANQSLCRMMKAQIEPQINNENKTRLETGIALSTPLVLSVDPSAHPASNGNFVLIVITCRNRKFICLQGLSW